MSVVRSARGARAPPCARARPRMGGTQIPRSAPQLRATAQAECMCCCTWRGGQELEEVRRTNRSTPRPERGELIMQQGHHAHARALPTRMSTGAACVSTLGLRVYREARDGLSPSFPAAPDLFRLLCLRCSRLPVRGLHRGGVTAGARASGAPGARRQVRLISDALACRLSAHRPAPSPEKSLSRKRGWAQLYCVTALRVAARHVPWVHARCLHAKGSHQRRGCRAERRVAMCARVGGDGGRGEEAHTSSFAKPSAAAIALCARALRTAAGSKMGSPKKGSILCSLHVYSAERKGRLTRQWQAQSQPNGAAMACCVQCAAMAFLAMALAAGLVKTALRTRPSMTPGRPSTTKTWPAGATCCRR